MAEQGAEEPAAVLRRWRRIARRCLLPRSEQAALRDIAVGGLSRRGGGRHLRRLLLLRLGIGRLRWAKGEKMF